MSSAAYNAFFLNSKSSIIQLELLEISHPNFSKTYFIVRNAINGVTVTLEDTTSQTFDYYPLSIKPTGSNTDLDQTLEINLGDLGDTVPFELDLVAADCGFGVKPVIKYRTYRSDDLTVPMFGPQVFKVNTISFTKDGATISASAPRLNLNQTGELYSMDRFTMMRGFL